jgi:hypothetical protein
MDEELIFFMTGAIKIEGSSKLISKQDIPR